MYNTQQMNNYYAQQNYAHQQQYYGQTVPSMQHQSHSNYNVNRSQYALPKMCSRSISQPVPQQQSGIVLQALTSSNAPKYCSSATRVPRPCIDSTNLQQFANYSQLQLQQALAQYPQWLQKEYIRRLQRQYEELYVVEDPKIHHWSAICPRDNDEKKRQMMMRKIKWK